MKMAEDVYALYASRRMKQSALVQQCIDVRNTYNGDMAIPMPEVVEDQRPAIANLLTIGLNHKAMRIASVTADIFCPSVKPGKPTYDDRARQRRKALLGMWEANTIPKLLRRRARHYLGYTFSPVMLVPDRKTSSAKWLVRDPLMTYPADTQNPDDISPPDCIFAFTRTLRWLSDNYPEETAMLERDRDNGPDTAFTLLEYIDDTERMLLVISKAAEVEALKPYSDGRNRVTTPTITRGGNMVGTERFLTLLHAANRTGRCWAVTPGAITLDRPLSPFYNMVGLYQDQARTHALEQLAIEEGIFPNTWAVSHANEQVQILKMADGRKGVVGKIQGGTVMSQNLNPGYQTPSMMDRQERWARIQGGVPADVTGESASNVRTGRRGENILSATLDFDIQEAQEIFAESLMAENKIAIAIEKQYFGSVPRSFYLSWPKAKGYVEYTPAAIYETDEHVVRYAFAGTDLPNFIIGIGQRKGLEMISTRTSMEMDPFIDDPEEELDRISAESTLRALQAAWEQQCAAGSVPWEDAAWVAEQVQSGAMSQPEAIVAAQKRAQERQAVSGPVGAPEGPVPVGSPAAQPGMNAPGVGAEAGSGIPGLPTSFGNLDQLLGQLYPAQAASDRAQRSA